MRLIHSPASPFARKVVVLLRETGQLDDVEIVSVTTTPFETDPGLAAANPLGKIPALIRDDAPAIYDSRVITRFLDARAGGGFYPEARLWEVLTLEATADGIMDAAVAMVYEGRLRKPEQVSEAVIEAQWAKVARALSAIESRWISNLSGQPDMAQIALGCAVEYLDLRHAARDWRKDAPALAKWQAQFAERPAMQATRPQ